MAERLGRTIATGFMVAAVAACGSEHSSEGGSAASPEASPPPATATAAASPTAEATPSPTAVPTVQPELTLQPEKEIEVEVLREASTYFEMGGPEAPRAVEVGQFLVAYCFQPGRDEFVGILMGEGALYVRGQDPASGQEIFDPPLGVLAPQLPACAPGQ